MKSLIFLACATWFSISVSAEVTDSGTSSMSMEQAREPRLRDLGVSVNPQIGVSGFEYSGKDGGSAKPKPSLGVTAEFGARARKMETGLMAVQTGSDFNGQSINNTYLVIPMMAKLRVYSQRAQDWYAKAGFMSAFLLDSSEDGKANAVDVLYSLGVGGRLYYSKSSDFIVEATYNRGLMDAIRGAGRGMNQGVLVMAGMSFAL